MADTVNVVVAKGVSVVFDGKFKALDNVSTTIPSGQVVGFIGPSGAGKTTLIRSIVGRQKLSAGELTVLDTAAGSAKLRSRLSYMTQENSIYPDLTVRQNLRYFATMFGVKRRDQTEAINQLLQIIDMKAQADQVVSTLSGGQKQRVSLSVALIGKPELMVLDEPTVGLDPLLRDQIWELFRQLADEGTSLIISSHVMDEAERCDSLILVREGKILAQGTPKELCQQTNTKSVEQAFLHLVKGRSA